MRTRRSSFLVETYWPGVTLSAAQHAADLTVGASAAMRRDGHSVRLVCALLVPADEAVLGVFEGASLAEIEQMFLLAGTPFDRISPTVQVARPNAWNHAITEEQP